MEISLKVAQKNCFNKKRFQSGEKKTKEKELKYSKTGIKYARIVIILV